MKDTELLERIRAAIVNYCGQQQPTLRTPKEIADAIIAAATAAPVEQSDAYSEGVDDAARVSRTLNNVAASGSSTSARAAAEEIAKEINGGDRKDCTYPPALVALLDDCSIANEKALADWLETIIERHCFLFSY